MRLFTNTPIRGKPQSLKDDAIKLYKMGNSFRGIGKFLGISTVTVLRWVCKAANNIKQQIDNNSNEEPFRLQIVQIDEM